MGIRAALGIAILATSNPTLAAKPSAPAVSAAPAVTLRIATERMPPSSMVVDGVISGRETDKIRELMARTGTAYTLELLPWKRAYVGALTHDHACVYSTTRTPAREPLFKWVGATDYAEWQLWGRVDAGLSLKTLEDARRGARGGIDAGVIVRQGADIGPFPWQKLERVGGAGARHELAYLVGFAAGDDAVHDHARRRHAFGGDA